MALVVEDGSRLATAEAYISVADADVFHANRNNTAWTGLTVSVKEAALRKAADYMVQMYRERWMGARSSVTQALDWPRIGVYLNDTVGYYSGYGYVSNIPYNVVPPEIKTANAILAFKALDENGLISDLSPDLDRATRIEKVGALMVEYEPGSPQYRRYRSVDGLLRPFLYGGNSSSQVIRR